MTSRLVSTELRQRELLCTNAVCRVVRKDKDHGTGFVIAHRLIITNNHVLPDEVTCEDSHAEFFYEKGMKVVAVKLDPKSFFSTSQTPGSIAPPTKKTLDFTIVALQPCDDENLKRVYLTPLSIFKDTVDPQIGTEAFIIQHPKEGEDSSKKIPEGKTSVIAVDGVTVHYNTPTKGGSSGGPVLNSERRLYALHRLGKCLQHGSECNQGVLIRDIVTFLGEEKDRHGKLYIESVRAWIAEKETPQNKAASVFFLMARKDVEKAREHLKHSKRKFEAIDRMEVIQQFTKALRSCNQAIETYKRQPSSDAKLQAEAEYVQKEVGLLKWQRLLIFLDLYLPLCLPNPEDQDDPFVRLLLEDQPLDALDDIIKMQEEALKETPELKEKPSFCFFFAIVFETIKENSAPLSARWYVGLAQIYKKNKQNIFWVRNCLDRAKKIYPQVLTDKEYITIDQDLQAKERKVEQEFLACLDDIKKQTGLEKPPTCFILHDETKETKDWVRNNLRSALTRIGARPIDETDNTENIPPSFFSSRQIQHADFILQLCTPKIVKGVRDSFSQIFFDLSMLVKQYPGFSGRGIFAFLIKGSYAESIPFFNTSGEGNKIDAFTTESYYNNSLSAFAKIMGLNDLSFISQLQDRFKERKKAIEQSEILGPSYPIKPIASILPPLTSSPSTRYAGPLPDLLSTIPREEIDLKELFEKFNLLILTQPEDVSFKTGKTCIARTYANSTKYEYIIWFNARSEESLKKSLEQIQEDLKSEEVKDLMSFLNGKTSWLLIFDDAESEASVHPYLPLNILPELSDCPAEVRRRILITSRNRSWNCGAAIPVKPFSDSECKTLIKNITQRTPDETQFRQIAVYAGSTPRRISSFAQWLRGATMSFESVKASWRSKLESDHNDKFVAKSNVPIFNPEFIGRADILAGLEECFEQRGEVPVIASLHGPSGNGKTHIAAHFALVNGVKYNAICWIDCTNSDTIALSYQQLAKKFNLPADSNPQEAVKSYLNNQKSWLMIFDHLSSYELIPSQLPTSYGHVLTTSSQPNSDKKVSTFPIEVPLLNLYEGTSLIMNAKQDVKQSIDESEVRACVDTLSGHPLYLTCAIKFLIQTKQKVVNYLGELNNSTQRNPAKIPQFIFEQTWNQLSAEEISFLKFCVGSNLVPLKITVLKRWAELNGITNETYIHTLLKNLKRNYAVLDYDSETVFISPFFFERIILSSSDKERVNETLQKLKP